SGKDLSSTRTALRALSNGEVLGVFPEGRINEGDGMLPFHVGAAMMAIRTGAPVYPAAIEGSQHGKDMMHGLLHRHQAKLIFGPPVEFDRSSGGPEALAAATQK